MPGRTCDIAIVGGGLSGGLVALALARHRPELRVRLIEAGPVVGGNHRWSWFGPDLSPAGDALLATVRKVEWSGGYSVRFPEYQRHLPTPYRSIASEDFAATLERELAPETIITGAAAIQVGAAEVQLENREPITARAVIDARGFPLDPAIGGHLRGGWQVFMGRHIETPKPHGIAHPVIMDASVAQLGGYRFVYVLPLGAHELFIEDTYYQDTPQLDRSALSARIDDYARAHGWQDARLVSFETGVLPVVTGGNFSAYLAGQQAQGLALVGARGGFWHPLTSYTLPFAVQVALDIVQDADLPGDQLAALLRQKAVRHWRKTRPYRQLGAMLFGAALPEERYRVLQRFYRLRVPLIERFYAAHSTVADRLRVLAGRPPVPLGRAVTALFGKQPPLALTEEGNWSR